MSRRHLLAGVTGAAFVLVLLAFTPVSTASYNAVDTGTVQITFDVPTTPEPPLPDPDPDPQPEQPFDWNWTYEAPTCDGVTIAFPSNLPASQQGVMEVNVTGGSISGMQYKLEGNDYQAKYPNGHAGQTVTLLWGDFRNYAIPATGAWTVTQLQVHGTNFHWQGNLICGNESELEVTLEPTPEPEVVSEPEEVPLPDPAPAPAVEPTPAPAPTPAHVPEPEPEPLPAPVQEEAKPEEVPEQPAEPPAPLTEGPESVPAVVPEDEEGTIQE